MPYPHVYTFLSHTYPSNSWLALWLLVMQSKKMGHCAVPASVLLWAVAYLVLRQSQKLLKAMQSLCFHSKDPEVNLCIIQVPEKARFVIKLLANSKYSDK